MTERVHDVAPAAATATLELPRHEVPAPQPQEVHPPGAGGDWPRTRRVLPWWIAAFVLMVYLIPFQSVFLPVPFPVDPQLDRFVLGGLFIVWVLAYFFSPHGRPRFKRAPMNVAVYFFVVACGVSIAVNLRRLSWDGELQLAIKQLSLVVSYLFFFYIAATSIRPSEVRAYAKFVVGLALLTAIGTIYQFRSGVNVFYSLASSLLKGTTVTAPPVNGIAGARAAITGPALHGLADATLLASAVPFALVFAANATRGREKAAWLVTTIVIFAGCVATQRKTALIVPVISVVVLVAYEPRRFLRYWPLIPVLVLAIRLAAPHSISGLLYQFTHAGSSTSTTDRTSDYSAVAPYLDNDLLFGRGYGSFDPHKYRILDDQMLGWLVEVGVVGVFAYAAMMFGAAATAHRVARRAVGVDGALMRAVVGGAAGFFVSNFLYDTFGFREAPYVFFFMAALGVAFCGVVANETAGRRQRSSAALAHVDPAGGLT